MTILLLHGLGGSPGSVHPLAEAMRIGGHRLSVPTLAGHGMAPGNLAQSGWSEWRRDAAQALGALDAPVVVVGQSMGASLALSLTADPLLRGHIRGVGCINPVVLSDPDAIEHLEWQLSRGTAMTPVTAPDLRRPDVADPSYEQLPLRSLIEMSTNAARIALADVTQPVFVATSTQDEVVDPANSDAVAAGVSGPVTRLALPRSGHSAALDYDRELLAAGLLAWIDRLPAR